MATKEFKGTKGRWFVERTSSEDGDFQGRILCESSIVKNPHDPSKLQIYIIAGEPEKRNGIANIHYEPDAQLIASAPKLLEALQETTTDLKLLLKNLRLEEEKFRNTRFEGYADVVEGWIKLNESAISSALGE
jgi:hypothetical protein